MAAGKTSERCSERVICRIPLKLPGLNDYIRACRANRYAGSEMKRKTEDAIAAYIAGLPRFAKPVKIDFLWVEATRRRDLDNVAFAKKFVLDALVKCGKLKNDDRRYVTAFTDSFATGEQAVILTITEEENEA